MHTRFGKHNIYLTSLSMLSPLTSGREQAKNGASTADITRFAAKIKGGRGNECWMWTASVTGRPSHQYGQFVYGQTKVYAHRFAWELVNGPVPAGKVVCHSCDVTRCCNPLEWARWFGKADRVIGKTRVGGANVSTVFLGLDHSFGQGPPLIFETLVFGGNHADHCERYSTLEEARAGHARIVRANLSGANGVQPERCTPLLMLLDQPGPIRLYKLVTADGVGPFNGGITYEVGKSYEVADANTDVTEQCGAGINVATLDWCLANWCDGYRVLVVECEAKDIAAIPTATDGKIRLHRCRVIGEKDIAALVAKPVTEKVA